MHVIATCLPDWRTLDIHESSPCTRGASYKLKREAPRYISTQFHPTVARGARHPTLGYRCEDLSAQTFADGSFDLVVTQDVFEHLPNPGGAISEIARTLRPGGFHIATIPIVRRWRPSRPRASFGLDGAVTHILPPQYHGNPVDASGALVTMDWGLRHRRISWPPLWNGYYNHEDRQS